MTQPIIGVTGARRGGRAMWLCAWISLWLQGAKAVRIVPPFDAAKLDGLDGLLIGGGDDIGAQLYDGIPTPDVRTDPERDALEMAALAHLWDKDVPILGICRGSQMLNVFHGGRLHRDIHEVYQGLPHIRTPLPRKQVTLTEGTRLAEVIGQPTVIVNSLHHQSVDKPGRNIVIAATDDYGVVQAIEHTGERFRVGVQWHPEMLFYRYAHRRLFKAFVSAARERAREPMAFAAT